MIRVYRDEGQGLWLELKEGRVTYIGTAPGDVHIVPGSFTDRFILVTNEWDFEEAHATYGLWELSE